MIERMRLLGTIKGVKVYIPKSHSWGKYDLNYLPEILHQKIVKIATKRKEKNFKERKVTTDFKVFVACEQSEERFILKGEDLDLFEVSCQIAQLCSKSPKELGIT
jgi:hypothetical protein